MADGVYYADINMRNASNPKQYSMGNAALRGSDSYKAKRTDDTAYRPIVVVQGGKATALVEFMPMGYLGMYGFMMELEGIYPGSFTRYGMPNASDPKTVFTPTQTLTYQKTQAATTTPIPSISSTVKSSVPPASAVRRATSTSSTSPTATCSRLTSRP